MFEKKTSPKKFSGIDCQVELYLLLTTGIHTLCDSQNDCSSCPPRLIERPTQWRRLRYCPVCDLSAAVSPPIKFALDSYVITSSIILSFCEFVGNVDVNSFSSKSYHQVGIFLSIRSRNEQGCLSRPLANRIRGHAFSPMTLTLTRWPWYMNLTWRFRRCTCIQN